MIRYVIVNDLTTTVVDVKSAATINAIDVALPLHRNIVESDWVEGSNPAIGDQWDGSIPATFTPIAPETDVTRMTGVQLIEANQRSAAMVQAVADEQARRAALGGIAEG